MLRAVAAWLLWIATIGPGHAQDHPLFARFSSYVTDEAVVGFRRHALENIAGAMCEGSSRCAPATAAELADPPISMADGKAALTHAIISALAEWCDLDWHRSFLPMMAVGRHRMKMSDRQLALMALMHGMFQSTQLNIYRSKGKCPDQVRADLDSQLPKIPGRP